MNALIVANWKMNPTSWREAKRLFDATKQAADATRGIELLVAPPALYLHELAASYRGARICFAAQNAHPEPHGAHTGDISMTQVKDAGARAVIIGHVERRAAGETNEDTRAKVASALKQKLTPILCVGEHARSSSSADHFDFVGKQLREGLLNVPPSSLTNIIIAYEPVWAIGGDRAMSPRDMHEMAIFIRKTIVDAYGAKGHKVKILYGGAVDAENAPSMLADGDVDGLLVGRVSTESASFKELLLAIKNA